MTNYTTSTPRTTNPADVYGLLGVGTSNTGVLLDANSLISSLPDATTIGGVMYFNRPTKPTERSAGVPLVIGDRWYNTNDGTEWFWNGTYWLGPRQFVTIRRQVAFTGDTYLSTDRAYDFAHVNTGSLANVASVFVEKYNYAIWLQSAGDASNYWTIRPSTVQTGGSFPSINVSPALFANGDNGGEVVLNSVLSLSTTNNLSGNYHSFGLAIVKVGSAPAAQSAVCTIHYRMVAP